MFNTTGQSHSQGIENEKFVIDFLNNMGFYSSPLVHLGGTQNKADAMAGDVSVSIKRKVSLKKGSYFISNP